MPVMHIIPMNNKHHYIDQSHYSASVCVLDLWARAVGVAGTYM